jgi:chaperonin cofactor prefoldin
LYSFKLFPRESSFDILGFSFEAGFYGNIQVFAWTLMQKIVPVISLTGIYLLFPPIKNERVINIYWLIFPLFSIYFYQSIWAFPNLKEMDNFFSEFVVWATIMSSIFVIALLRQFLIQRERKVEQRIEALTNTIDKLRDEQVYEIFASLYNIELVSDVMKNGETNAAEWREKINDYALEGMQNVNKVLSLLDDQKEELNRIENDESILKKTKLSY